MSLASSTNPVVSSIAGGRELQLADQGNLFVAITPTPGTGIIGGVVNTFVETTPWLVLYNGGAANVNVYPLYLKMNVSVAGTTDPTVATWLTNTLDTGNRLSLGGTALTKSNCNMNSSVTSASIITVGAITATAASGSRRVVSHSKVRSLKIGVIHDSITLNWGDSASTLTAVLANNSTTHSDTVINCAPVVIGSGQSMSLVLWANAQTVGTTYEVEFAYVEK
jgi:hypothetical protein